jgi:hypothetical protein
MVENQTTANQPSLSFEVRLSLGISVALVALQIGLAAIGITGPFLAIFCWLITAVIIINIVNHWPVLSVKPKTKNALKCLIVITFIISGWFSIWGGRPEYKLLYDLADEGNKILEKFNSADDSKIGEMNKIKTDWCLKLQNRVPKKHRNIFKNQNSVNQYYDQNAAFGVYDRCTDKAQIFRGDQQGLCIYICVLKYLAEEYKKRE